MDEYEKKFSLEYVNELTAFDVKDNKILKEAANWKNIIPVILNKKDDKKITKVIPEIDELKIENQKNKADEFLQKNPNVKLLH